jgi:hypothetical protein
VGVPPKISFAPGKPGMHRRMVNDFSNIPRAKAETHSHERLLLGKLFAQSLVPTASLATELYGSSLRGDDADVALHRVLPSHDESTEWLRAVFGQ